MGFLKSLIHHILDGAALKRFENSRKLRESISVLVEKYGFEVFSYYYDENIDSTYFDSRKEFDDLSQITLEVYSESKLKRLHLDYSIRSEGHRKVYLHYGNELENIYYVHFHILNIFLESDKRTDEMVDYFLKWTKRLEEEQKNIEFDDEE